MTEAFYTILLVSTRSNKLLHNTQRFVFSLKFSITSKILLMENLCIQRNTGG